MIDIFHSINSEWLMVYNTTTDGFFFISYTHYNLPFENVFLSFYCTHDDIHTQTSTAQEKILLFDSFYIYILKEPKPETKIFSPT